MMVLISAFSIAENFVNASLNSKLSAFETAFHPF
ncbi:MAG: hypothetical protein ACJAWO_000084 [Halieaceae bacterium]|jgi:hypothetical protein